jgi:hypothetical protein
MIFPPPPLSEQRPNPKTKTIKAANYFPGRRQGYHKDTDVYVIASNKDYVEISFNNPAG